MDKKKFTLWNRMVALAVFLVAAVTYLLTIEPTASFWDCGEFIASSYKLEVGHPPGNPVFQLFARVATMFADAQHAALAVNAMNAILSALTILLLYLTTVFLVKRLVKPSVDGTYSLAKAITVFGSGAVAALAYTFSDTFWFSAVEGEVYAMSSLFTALVFWAMTKWYEQADEPYANRWLVLIAFLMGLSIGVHILNLLAIPALVFMFYYRKKESLEYTTPQLFGIFGVSVVILAVVLYGVIPYLPRIAAAFDRFFVNTMGLPFNSGAAFFMLTLLGLCFWGLFSTAKAKNALWNTILLCFTMIVIGFSLFTIVIIRSSAKTPTNEYQPDNPYTLVRYLGREQYGSNPLIYGQAFDSPYTLKATEYWAPMPKKGRDGKVRDRYIKAVGPADVKYYPQGKMLFPRMWSSSSDSHKNFYKLYVSEPNYKTYIDEDGRLRKFSMPTFGDNLAFFFDFQMNWMYWRYFMWNFAGRQNDIHGPEPNLFAGNWESGIGFIDELRLTDQSDAPGYLTDNKGKNHYYMLPLLLGLIGLFFQFARDKRGCWITFLLFFMTGIAVVIYLNQPPYQVRERDYAYAGSFYAFSIWIGMAVAALYTWICDFCKANQKKGCETTIASSVTIAALLVPVLMAAENWDDHDRSNRYTAVEIAENYLNSVGENGILITHGDNDTFPLWYAQEVENIRPDVRIANTSLLGTDWHIDQMKWAMNESAPLALKLGPAKYLYGTNEILYVDPYGDNEDKVLPLKDVMAQIASGKCTLELRDGEKAEYVPARRFSVPVNKENVIKYGILDEKYADRIPDEIVLAIPSSKYYITKPELFFMDLLSNYEWDRPINMLSMGGDINIGQKDYLMYEGFSYKFVPVKNRMSSSNIGFSDPDDLYYKMKNVFKWDALKRTDYFVDYQNYYTFCGVLSQRQIFVNVARELMEDGQIEKAVEILDLCQECVPELMYPLDISYYGFVNEYMVADMIQMYFDLGESEKGRDMLNRFAPALCESMRFFSCYNYTKKELSSVAEILVWLISICQADVYNVMDQDPKKAAELMEQYDSWIPVELMSYKPESQVWLTYFSQCDEFDRAGSVAHLFDMYVDVLMEQFEAYFDEYATLGKKSQTIAQQKEKLQSQYYEVYSNYSSASSSQAEALERKMDQLETEFEKLMNEESQVESSMADLEDIIYNCLYLFEDAISLTDAYGSDKADQMRAVITAVYGE